MIRRRQSAETASLAAFSPPIAVTRPNSLNAPVIFASPHSGHIYPDSFVDRAAQPLNVLRRNEDAFVDELFAPVVDHGAPLLSARFPRCFLDVNRAADELPRRWRSGKTLSTQRAELGLGVIPTMISETLAIYKRQPRANIVTARLNMLYHPYHQALQSLIDEALSTFGQALVIDCHSMPGFTPQGTRRADIILGDRYGVSCRGETLTLVEQLFTERGYGVTRNYPYAGGYVAAHYGNPQDNVEVIQIEINRDLYLNPVSLKRKKGYDQLAADLSEITQSLVATYAAPSALAAE